MVSIRLEDVSSSSLHFSGWQCLLCGEITDHGIKANRIGHKEPRANRARPQGSMVASGNGRKRKSL